MVSMKLQKRQKTNSNTRKGDRSYNEMYLSNPNGVMGVFAYSEDNSAIISNPVEFVNNKHEFLRNFALKNNLPMIVFGD